MKKSNLIKELNALADPKRAKVSLWFFKTGPGQYGEADRFLGISVPALRKVAFKYIDLSLPEIKKFLHSPIHEHRFVALEILVAQYEKGQTKTQKQIVDFYLKNRKWINNWDLVDTSVQYILGDYLLNKNKGILSWLAKSKNIWERRMAIVATARFIKELRFTETLKISKLLLVDEHDLIHKAVGWMLREVGNRSPKTEKTFLKKHYRRMPRTMLRYAIEKFPPKERAFYLKRQRPT